MWHFRARSAVLRSPTLGVPRLWQQPGAAHHHQQRQQASPLVAAPSQEGTNPVGGGVFALPPPCVTTHHGASRHLEGNNTPAAAAAAPTTRRRSMPTGMLMPSPRFSLPTSSSSRAAFSRLSFGRRYQSSGPSSTVDQINAEDIEVEVATTSEEHHHHQQQDGSDGSGSHGGGGDGGGDTSGSGGGGSSGRYIITEYEDVVAIDHFCRAKIMNYIKRISQEEGKFETTELHTHEGTVYRSKIKIPVPAEYGIRIAEGYATTVKDAESLAAMHGTTIVDALGLKLYTLSSMQRKHAEAVRLTGRWAPYPEDDPKSPSTKTPKAKRKLTSRDESEEGKWQLLDVTPRHYRTPVHTLLVPTIVDPTATFRMKKLFEKIQQQQQQQMMASRGGGGGATSMRGSTAGFRDDAMDGQGAWGTPSSSSSSGGAAAAGILSFDDALSVFNSNNIPDSIGLASKSPGACQMFVAELRLPIPEAAFGPAGSGGGLVSKGKALDRGTAVTLACMHAELMLDALGFPLYPDDPVTQRMHAQSARSFGRSAPMPGETMKQPNRVQLPLPLKQFVSLGGAAATTNTSAASSGHSGATGGSTATDTGGSMLPQRCAVLSEDERLVQSHVQFAESSATFEAVSALDPQAKDMLADYLKRLQYRRTDPYFVERVGSTFPSQVSNTSSSSSQSVYRATVLLPLPHGDTTVRVAMGTGMTAVDAEILCAMHAVEMLARMGIPIYELGSKSQAAWEAKRKERGSPMPTVGGAAVPLPAPYRLAVASEYSTQAEAAPSTAIPMSHHQRGVAYLAEQQRLAEARAEALEKMRATEGTAATIPKTAGATAAPITAPPIPGIGFPGGAATAATSTTVAAPTATTAPATPPRRTTVVLDKEPPVDYKKCRDLIPKEHWNLEPDSADGYIVVSPKHSLDSAVSLGHTVPSPRQLDMLSRERLSHFLQQLGKRPDAFIKTVKMVTFDSTPFYRTTVRLPVPVGFGERVAVGEAPDSTESEILASMHAELTMDALGLPWFVDPKQQKKHAQAARKMGRYAPMPGEEPQPFVTPTPPGLRKERTDSVLWQKHVQSRYGELMNVNEAADFESIEVIPWRVALFAASFEAVPADALDVVSKERVRNYLRRQRFPPAASTATADDAAGGAGSGSGGAPVSEIEYVVEAAPGNVLHHIIRMGIPLPAKLGTRYAIGIALNKRDAEILCWMHAERIIDHLGVHMFNLPGLQRRHAERVAKEGRWAPLLGELVERDETTPSPMPLKIDDIGSKPKYPMPPPMAVGGQMPVSPPHHGGGAATASETQYRTLSFAELEQQDRAWKDYCQEAQKYVEAGKKHAQLEYLMHDRVPRTGDFVIDDALDEVERQPEIDKQVKSTLQQYCFQANVEYPVLWKTILVGPATARKSLTSVPVPGFEHIWAQGVGSSKQLSQMRATMHVLAILRRVDPDFTFFDLGGGASASEYGGSPAAMRRQKSMGSWDRMNGSFTQDGKVRLLHLFALCTGATPPVVQHRQRNDGGILSYVTTVEMTDVEGRKYIGRAAEAGKKINEPAAYDDLFSQLLQRVPSFGSLGQFLKTHPHLDPEHIVTLQIPKDVEMELNALVPIAAPPVPSGAPGSVTTTTTSPTENASSTAATTLPPTNGPTVPQEASTAKLTSTLNSVAQYPAEYLERTSKILQTKQASLQSHPEYVEKFKTKRESLSIFQKREVIVETIRQNPVTVICGTTGCGKTTQVPQYLLDAEIARGTGANCSILVTQPRRLSAMSIATRIAAERLEDIGDSVGYTIRLESKPGKHINFCTSGVLLRMLQSKPTLEGISVVIIDEIHERDINSDFLLILLKELLTKRLDLRVVLMSATLQSELFADYFEMQLPIKASSFTAGGGIPAAGSEAAGNSHEEVHTPTMKFRPPVINVEGFVYPVKEVYLEDIASIAKTKGFNSSSLKPFLSPTGASASAAAAAAGAAGSKATEKYDFKESGTEIDFPTLIFTIDYFTSTEVEPLLHAQPVKAPLATISSSPSSTASGSSSVVPSVAVRNPAGVGGGHGTILVFLPGWEEMTRVRDLLSSAPKYHVVLLHSSISAEEQMRCFQPAPEGKVKLVLSTNIAESGVTIDDVLVVIDVGLSKEKSYFLRKGRTTVGRHEFGSMSQLVTIFASRANCIQRKGRAGRTRPGTCVRLYTRTQFTSLADFQLPEMLRQPLDALCLQIVALQLGDPAHFLQKALEPPSMEAIEGALHRLRSLGALTKTRQLTPLGHRLSLLPISPRLGKMILFGAALKCLDSVLTIAACAEVDTFSQQRELKDVVRMHRLEFSKESWSDHIALLNSYNGYVNVRLLYQQQQKELQKMREEQRQQQQQQLASGGESLLSLTTPVIQIKKDDDEDAAAAAPTPTAADTAKVSTDSASSSPAAVAEATSKANPMKPSRFTLVGNESGPLGIEGEVDRYVQEHGLNGQSLDVVSKYKQQFYEILVDSGFVVKSSSLLPTSTSSSSAAAGATGTERPVGAEGGDATAPPVIPATAPLDASAAVEASAIQKRIDAVEAQERRLLHEGLPFVDTSRYSTYRNNVALVKAAVCTALFPNIALYRDKKIFRSKLDHMIYINSGSVVAKSDTDTLMNPFFVFEELMQSGGTVGADGSGTAPAGPPSAGNPAAGGRLMMKGATNVSLWALLLLGANQETHIRFRDDLNLMVMDDWIVFRATAETMETVLRLKLALNDAIEKKFVEPGNTENEHRLHQLQRLVRRLVNLPIQPPSVSSSSSSSSGAPYGGAQGAEEMGRCWEERGSVIEVGLESEEDPDEDDGEETSQHDTDGGETSSAASASAAGVEVAGEASLQNAPSVARAGGTSTGVRVLRRGGGATASAAADRVAAVVGTDVPQPPTGGGSHASHTAGALGELEDSDDRGDEILANAARHLRQELEADLYDEPPK